MGKKLNCMDSTNIHNYIPILSTMNLSAHSTRKAMRESARLLDQVTGNAEKEISLILSKISCKHNDGSRLAFTKYTSQRYNTAMHLCMITEGATDAMKRRMP